MEEVSDFLASKPRIRIGDLQEAKNRKQKFAMLTTYDAISSRIFDAAQVPCLLVGDSAAQVVFGHKSTLPITMDEMIPLARAVASSADRALVIADLPFGSYQASPQTALENATRFMKEAQVHAVKLEGGREFVPHVELLTRSGIPVMAHVGFTPQSEHTLSGYKIQGRDSAARAKIIGDASLLQEAGAFACVIEMAPADVGRELTASLKIPTIGIGAGPHCDGQVLVWTDMVGFSAPIKAVSSKKPTGYLSERDNPSTPEKRGNNPIELSRVPKFVKRYANVTEVIYKAARQYVDEVRDGSFPAEEHCYN